MLINKIKVGLITTFIIAIIIAVIYAILNLSYSLGICILKQSFVVILLKITAITAIGLTVIIIMFILLLAIFCWAIEPIAIAGEKI